MAKGFYVPVSGLSKKAKKWYVPVNLLSKSVVKAYCSESGLSTQFWPASDTDDDYKFPEDYDDNTDYIVPGADIGRTIADCIKKFVEINVELPLMTGAATALLANRDNYIDDVYAAIEQLQASQRPYIIWMEVKPVLIGAPASSPTAWGVDINCYGIKNANVQSISVKTAETNSEQSNSPLCDDLYYRLKNINNGTYIDMDIILHKTIKYNRSTESYEYTQYGSASSPARLKSIDADPTHPISIGLNTYTNGYGLHHTYLSNIGIYF